MNSSSAPVAPVAATAPVSLAVSLRRVVMLSAVCGIVEVIGYMDVGNIYPAIMTGNTVQLGWSLARGEWVRFLTLGFAILSFFVGCMIASLIRRHLRRPALELGIMAVLLLIIGVIRLYPLWRVPVELPLLALALGMQGETISRFGGVSLQTLVVTNNMVKFSDAFVGRYLVGAAARAKRPPLNEMLLPGVAWLTYSLAAALGALADKAVAFPFAIPAVLLLVTMVDLVILPDA